MENGLIEIREVKALRVDAAGRVGRLRVIGVADRTDERIRVDACVAELAADASWPSEQAASAIARIVDPARTFVGHHTAQFAADLFEGERRTAHLWVAEIDLLASPAIAPIVIGRQPVPVHVRARYIFVKDSPEPKQRVDEILPIDEFDLGVLFVHGIGRQRRAETLAQWSAPLARWITAWLQGGADEIASRLPDGPMEGWMNSLVVREDLNKVDLDYVDRAAYAKDLVHKALAPTYTRWQDERDAVERQASTSRQERCTSPEEHSDAETVIRTIREQIQASAVGGAAEFREAYVLDVGARAVDPSSVEMHVEAMDADGYMLRSRWMLAESHWAETFWAPSFFGFGRWCLLTAPVLLVHYIAMARLRHAGSTLRWLVGVFGLASAVTLAEIAFLLLTVLWLVPWERLRKGVLRVQLQLAGVVGDSYVLLEDPVQRRAILDRVHRDLEWLVQRCRNVVLIAHSQGAAVAELVLSQREEAGAGKIHSFATLGAGVQTLTAIEQLAKSRSATAAGWAAIGCMVVLVIAALLAMTIPWPLALALALLALAGLALAALRASNAHPGRPVLLPRAGWLRPWLDFFARKDLVPYGPLVDPQNNGENYRPKEVHNRDSFLADHVTYWQNTEQVVGPLARQIGVAAGFAPLSKLLPNDGAVLARLERARLSRLGFLLVARAVAILATAALVVAQWDALVAVVHWALAWAPSKLGLATSAGDAPPVAVWLQAFAALVPWIVHSTLINATWDAWSTGEVERLLKRSAGAPAMAWTSIFVTMLVVIAAATIEFVWPITPWVMLVATALAALALASLAWRVHLNNVDGRREAPPVVQSAT